jgi:hypothetical protein
MAVPAPLHIICLPPDPPTFVPSRAALCSVIDMAVVSRCLRIAGMVDEAGDWIGGTSHFVQLGMPLNLSVLKFLLDAHHRSFAVARVQPS